MQVRLRRALPLALSAAATGCNGLLDPEAPAWREIEIETETSPRPRWGHVLAHDAARDRLLLFGGSKASGALGDTWALSLETGQWEELSTSEGPSPRVSPAAVLDAPRDRLVVAGGHVAEDTDSDEVWALDLATLTWSELAPLPYGLHEAVAANDEERAWLFGGLSGSGTPLEDLHELDLATGSWTVRTHTGPHPAARAAGGIAKRGDQLVITMGIDASQPTGDTWLYDLPSYHWFRLAPEGAPVAGAHHAYAADAECDALVLVGGDDGDHYDVGLTSVLRLDEPPGFDLMPSSNALPPRHRAAAVIDVARRDLIVFGGVRGYAEVLGDTWIHPLGGCP